MIESTSELTPESEESNGSRDAGQKSQRPAGENPERESQQEKASYLLQGPLPFQEGKSTSVERGKYHERCAANQETSQSCLAVVLHSRWFQNRPAPDMPANGGSQSRQRDV